MMKKENPSFFAIIPADVRYSDITPNAKLLYGELTALSDKEGYCWASNKYFADLYNVSNRSITEWIKILIDSGFITIELSKKGFEEEDILTQRKIYIVKGGTKKTSRGARRKLLGGLEENFQYSNTDINTDILREQKPADLPKSQFDMATTLAKLESGKPHDTIIASYWQFKKFVFDNREKYSTEYRRSLRAAHALVKSGYSGAEIYKTMQYCNEHYKDQYSWSLETVLKRAAEVNQKK